MYPRLPRKEKKRLKKLGRYHNIMSHMRLVHNVWSIGKTAIATNEQFNNLVKMLNSKGAIITETTNIEENKECRANLKIKE